MLMVEDALFALGSLLAIGLLLFLAWRSATGKE
jgi:hypothetical protein